MILIHRHLQVKKNKISVIEMNDSEMSMRWRWIELEYGGTLPVPSRLNGSGLPNPLSKLSLTTRIINNNNCLIY